MSKTTAQHHFQFFSAINSKVITIITFSLVFILFAGAAASSSQISGIGSDFFLYDAISRAVGRGLTPYVLADNIRKESSITPALLLPPVCTPPTGVIISEFRLRGANGLNDEFIELYNNTDQALTICTADGSNGWALVSSDGVIRVVVPSSTLLPARAHYLIAGSGYSLNAYAAADLSYNNDIPDNSGLVLFNTADVVNFIPANRLDAVGFTTVTNSTYREGLGLAPILSNNGEYSFVRKINLGVSQDSGDNAADFVFVAPNGGNYGGVIAVLGAPGPENLGSPIQRNSSLPVTVLDPAVSSSAVPNRVRDTAATGPNAALGTLTIRKKVTNSTGGLVTRLRFRLIDVTTLNTPGYVQGGSQADLRALNSSDSTVSLSNGTPVLVRGTSVEAPPGQANGGGLNTSVSVFGITLSEPLAPGKDVAQPLNATPIDQTAPGLSLEIPDARWEPAFFEALEARTKKAGLSSLRTVLPDHDLEVRFWYDHFEVISGLIIRRSGEKWSATYLRQTHDHQPSSVLLESLEAPKSGWEATWRKLTSAGILTLPDGSTTKCKSDVLDGISYVVETNLNRKYRTYRYGNPQFAECDEAKRIRSIENILFDEFRLRPSQK